MKGQQIQEQVAMAPRQPDGSGGTVLDFAADYPGVMIALVVFLLGISGFFVKRYIARTAK